MYEYDKRVVLTLDAGGTNFVFSAIQGNNEMISPIGLPAVSDNLDECLEVLVKGFDRVIAAIPVPPVAISFAFPGPADYENGIIGDLPNFPSFRGGVALGPFLKHKYGIPVFIENDGNLFAYGEALSGALPMINRELSLAGCSREYKNLIGITLGTGFGAGVVINKVLLTGDNGCGGDIWLMRNKKYPDMLAEESVSIRAVRRVYSDLSGQSSASLSPKDIYDIAEGIKEGDSHAAIASFNELGIMAGAAIASVLNVVDGEDRADILIAWGVAVETIVVDRDKSCLPVVAVDNIRLPAVEMGDGLQDGTREKGEPLGVIVVSVETGALKIVLIVDEIVGDTVIFRLKDAAVLATPGNRNIKVQEIGHILTLLVGNTAIERKDDADVHAIFPECFRERPRHFGKSAADGEGGCFTGSE